jgi:hypothetical protein
VAQKSSGVIARSTVGIRQGLDPKGNTFVAILPCYQKKEQCKERLFSLPENTVCSMGLQMSFSSKLDGNGS